jgi:hypothetical protein
MIFSTLRQGYFNRFKLAAHVFEEGHQIGCNKTDILQFQPHSVYRKYGDAAHMFYVWITLLANPV